MGSHEGFFQWPARLSMLASPTYSQSCTEEKPSRPPRSPKGTERSLKQQPTSFTRRHSNLFVERPLESAEGARLVSVQIHATFSMGLSIRGIASPDAFRRSSA